MKERSVSLEGRPPGAPRAPGHLNCAVGPKNGPPLVLFHGVTRCWQDFEPLLAGLTASWQVWALDHRGHGGSSRCGSRYRVTDFAADAAAFLDRELSAAPPAVLVGHSLGALVAAVVAAERPARVSALVLEDPPGTTLGTNIGASRFHLQFANTRALLNDPALDRAALARALADMPVQRPADGAIVPFRELRDGEALRFSAGCLARLDPAVLDVLNSGGWLDDLDWFGLLPRIACPTLLLRADPACGGMLAEAEAARIEAVIRHCTRADLPGVGHSIHSREPARMLELIFRFLAAQQPCITPARPQP